MLIKPTAELHDSFLAAHQEWSEEHQDGSGVEHARDIQDPEAFREWIAALERQETVPLKKGYVTCSYYWLVEDREFLGAIALRHELNDYLLNFGGHVGYSIRPSERGRGLATQALRELLPLAEQRGLDRILLTCDVENYGSQKVIERCGGKLEDVRAKTMRYWIDL
ncbi:hypothetical protein CPHO_02380 [Corynebacterium phocae]|uniref:N-acetyltransferase domain-containing protein n=1 Tax=Corynebacterium phocae TaxID=161895 RepID=A0A1L7D1C6_9CORY|nr:GNAT family N-acetyltransferase [Corynebacterium phocae]APT91945.1 hypothetical protein CPHO_02380 [Corynebacterium phocae]KAA8726931.1 GNAT family N-acetyltransferase [Corynebacterium phocae]